MWAGPLIQLGTVLVSRTFSRLALENVLSEITWDFLVFQSISTGVRTESYLIVTGSVYWYQWLWTASAWSWAYIRDDSARRPDRYSASYLSNSSRLTESVPFSVLILGAPSRLAS